MTQSAVSLQEIRAHLQFEESDGHDDDDELWRTVLTATGRVEARLGPIRPRQQVSRCTSDGRTIQLPVYPVLSVESVADYNGLDVPLDNLYLNTDTGCVEPTPLFGYLPRFPFVYTVTYTVGQDPISQESIEAVLLQAGLLWSTQRGPESSSRFSALGGEGYSPGGLDALRLEQILCADRVFGVA